MTPDFDPRNVDDWSWGDYVAMSVSYALVASFPLMLIGAAWVRGWQP